LVTPDMLMPCLIAQAIFFIHLSGLQLCVAMLRNDRSIQDLVDNLEQNKVAVLKVVPLVSTSHKVTVYYVTVQKISKKMRLRLTENISEALTIGSYSGSEVDLPGVRCFQKYSLILMDER
jgi:hypothetical protein